MVYHAVGHGWTSHALGIDTAGWDIVQDKTEKKLLAQVDGQRVFFKGIPANTNLCYFQEEARSKFAVTVTEYAKLHPEVDVLHVWLADDCMNFCECDNCKKKSPSDWYVVLLNSIDDALTQAGLDTRIAFLAYCELLWPPVHERIINKDRFLLMFAPITRSYKKTYRQELEQAEFPPVPPYKLNVSNFPRSVAENVAFLRGWQEVFGGDSFLFDYIMMWEVTRDFSSVYVPQVIFDDSLYLKELGLNGNVSCQLQRVFFPHGFAMYILGKTLTEGEFDYGAEREKYFSCIYGELAKPVEALFETVFKELPVEYFRFEHARVDLALAVRIRKLKAAVIKFENKYGGHISKDAIVSKSVEILQIYTESLKLLCDCLYRKMRGESFADQKESWLNSCARARCLFICSATYAIGLPTWRAFFPMIGSLKASL